MEQDELISINNHLGATLESAEYAANLDEHAKELLADKTILAEIIQRLIPEFRGIPTEEIQTYINGTPYVSKIHINPGETNPSFEEAVRSLGQESRIQNEGLATFDILFGEDGGKHVQLQYLCLRKGHATGYTAGYATRYATGYAAGHCSGKIQQHQNTDGNHELESSSGHGCPESSRGGPAEVHPASETVIPNNKPMTAVQAVILFSAATDQPGRFNPQGIPHLQPKGFLISSA